ncbi:MAG: hypothetical protein Q9P44_21830 [Anaerolineae bacterium]|nr:hypothetical protein [Anaerolineae bacterium]
MNTDATKAKLDNLLAAASGLQMVSVVSQNTDKELDDLDAYAVELLTTADDEMAKQLRQRLHLLRSMREEQAEVLYSGFRNATGDHQLETFAFDIDDISVERLERVVHNHVLGEAPNVSKELTERLQKIQKMRRELKPIKDGVFRFLATDSLEEAEALLIEKADILLTETAGREILQANSRDRILRQRIESRKVLWRKIYGQVSGKALTGSAHTVEKAAEKESEKAAQPKPTIAPAPSSKAAAVTVELNQVSDNHNVVNEDEAVVQADRLMSEVYDLLDQAIGNAMVAFSIYRKNKSTRADEALKLLNELHNETKDS